MLKSIDIHLIGFLIIAFHVFSSPGNIFPGKLPYCLPALLLLLRALKENSCVFYLISVY